MTVGLLPAPSLQGPTGPTGPSSSTIGPTGFTGATGPTGTAFQTTNVACFNYTLSNGTSEIATSANVWFTRALNTTVYNGISGCSLSNTGAGSQIILPPGTYYVRVIAPTGIRSTSPNQAESHKILLYNNTTAANLIMGSSNQNNSAAAANPINHALLQGSFTLSIESTIKILHRTSGTGSFGDATSFGDDEIYTTITIFKLA